MKNGVPVIQVSALCVHREVRILDGINWSVEEGQHWVILGPNGSGKTSLLATLTGYMPPTSGTISVLGETYGHSDWRELRTHIGFVSTAIAPLMSAGESALETIASGRRAMLGFWGELSSDERSQALDILHQVEADALADRPWRYLSQGERQRILIGRALMANPRLLVLDEPCAGLDPVARERFLAFLQRLASSGTAPTMVLVTHHVEEITPAFTHVLIIKNGTVLAAGPKLSVLKSETLGDAFGARLTLRLTNGRYSLTVAPDSDAAV
ncbi:MAG: ABC transporter ATP-binding protein [Candidatus Binataceae bacterium]|jgi:iron complex transport system ATP-binding protein